MAPQGERPCRPSALFHGAPLLSLGLLTICLLCFGTGAEARTPPWRSLVQMHDSATRPHLSARNVASVTRSDTPGQASPSVTGSKKLQSTFRRSLVQMQGSVTRPDIAAQSMASVTRSDALGQRRTSVTGSEIPGQATRSVTESKKLQSTVRRWPGVKVMTRGGLSDFGWVRTSGTGVNQAQVYSRTCFNLTALSRKGGRPFDKGSRQKAFFVAYLSSGPVSLAADITYRPSRSSHRVCFTAPTVGSYQLDVRLVFVNTDAILASADGPAGQGFANYTRVLNTSVEVQGPAGYSLRKRRRTLPQCTHELLTETRNKGFWVANTWVPLKCWLRRLEPAEALRCLSGKRVLMLGNSQTRIAFGVLQAFLNSPSRDNFTARFAGRPKFLGDTIAGRVNANNGSQYSTYNASWDRQPPKNATSGLAFGTRIDFLKGVHGTFFGDIRNGFVFVQARTTLDQGESKPSLEVDFNITYSTYFNSRDPIFAPWMLDGLLTQGVLPTGNGKPFDVVFNANALHDVSNFNTSTEYARFMVDKFLPGLRPMLKERSSLTLFGGMSAVEARLNFARMRPTNPRIVAFENAGLKALEKKGYQSFMKIQYVTSPRQDLAPDTVHYGWPVSLTMIDLWLGPYCSRGS